MRRSILVLSLLCACLLTMGAGWLSGPRFGAGVRGFVQPPVARVSVAQTTDPNAAPTNGLVGQYLQDDWTYAVVPKVSNWNDSSPMNNDGTQSEISLQPEVLANGAISSVFGSCEFLSLPNNVAVATMTVVCRLVRPTQNQFNAQLGLIAFGPQPYIRAQGGTYQTDHHDGWRTSITDQWPAATSTYDDVVAATFDCAGQYIATYTGWMNGVKCRSVYIDASPSWPLKNNLTRLLNIWDFTGYEYTAGVRAIWFYNRKLTDSELANSPNWTWKK